MPPKCPDSLRQLKVHPSQPEPAGVRHGIFLMRLSSAGWRFTLCGREAESVLQDSRTSAEEGATGLADQSTPVASLCASVWRLVL
jgi:hypothetical protein